MRVIAQAQTSFPSVNLTLTSISEGSKEDAPPTSPGSAHAKHLNPSGRSPEQERGLIALKQRCYSNILSLFSHPGPEMHSGNHFWLIGVTVGVRNTPRTRAARAVISGPLAYFSIISGGIRTPTRTDLPGREQVDNSRPCFYTESFLQILKFKSGFRLPFVSTLPRLLTHSCDGAAPHII